MSSETIDLTIEAFLPEDIKHEWIPLDGLSVPHLFQFTRYPPQHMLYYEPPSLVQLLHEERVTNFDFGTLLQLGPPSPKLSDMYKAAIKGATLSIHSFTLVPVSGHSVRLPIWVLDYWREMKRAMGYRQNWKDVLEWLRGVSKSESMRGICDQVLAGLSCFPWNGSNCTVHDMASLLTESYLSDFHIDYALAKIFHHYQNHYAVNIANHHTFLTVFDLDSIVTAYKVNTRNARAAHKRQQLLDIENKIISGHIDSVAGVLHLTNHWTSLVIIFKPPKILYGDSLGYSIPSKKASAFRRWMCHMLDRSGHEMPESDISIYPLPTMKQQDLNSCGLFALNAVHHHYLPQNSPLLQPDISSVAHCRLEFALDHLQDGAVS
jgi:hypothetical protein